MKQHGLQWESFLELGLLFFGSLMIGSLLIVLFGHTVGAVQRRLLRAERPPRPGTVPPKRHSNIFAVATR